MSKPIAKSKTAHGATAQLVTGILILLASRLGVDISEGELVPVAGAVALIVNFAWTIWGRFKASGPVRIR